jgi:FkbM family methyltransferase
VSTRVLRSVRFPGPPSRAVARRGWLYLPGSRSMPNWAERWVRAAWLARNLTRGAWRVQAFVVLAALDVIPPRLRKRLGWIRLSLPSGRVRRFWLEDLTQAKVLGEVMVDREYDIPIEGEVRTVVDLGANAGQTSVYLRDRFPDASILAVEADPATARLAARNTREDPNTVVRSAAVSDHNGTVTLTRLPGQSWGSNLFSAWSSPEASSLQVSSVNLGTVLREHGLDEVDLLKVDVEGAELMALTSDTALEHVRSVVGEFHPSILAMDAPEALRIL